MSLDVQSQSDEMDAPEECLMHSTGADNSHRTDMRTATRPIPALTEADKERFWSKVDRRGPNECWEWMRGKDKDGYGAFSVGFCSQRSHRISFLIFNGTISPELEVCHHCDNPGCCNPVHLSKEALRTTMPTWFLRVGTFEERECGTQKSDLMT